MSGDRLAMIDPHEKYFKYQGNKTTGFSWHLGKQHKEMKHLSDQFQPFKGLFGASENTFKQGKYPGTLFRFPLRKTPSELSETIYTTEKATELLKSFYTDAHLVLLFLNHIESVEIYIRTSEDQEPKLLFKVKQGGDLPQIRKLRARFIKSIESGKLHDDPIKNTFPMTISLYKDKEEIKHQWLVTNYFAGKNISPQLNRLIHDPLMSHSPLVGVAMPIYGKKSEIQQEEESSQNVLKTGQVFCFLPLPIEQRSTSGLPVNVNGYFAVDQNRRHLKWPMSGQKSVDKSVLWNQCLLNELIPSAYLELLLAAIDLQKTYPNYISVSDIYSAIPAQSQVNEKWQGILQPFYCTLFQKAVINTQNKSRWKHINDVVLDYHIEDSEMRNVLNMCLLQCDVNVASVPSHVIEALYNGGFVELDTVQPELVSKCCKINATKPDIMYSRQEKLLIVKYLLLNGKPADLLNLELLPLADGNFCMFCDSFTNVPKIYVDSIDHPRKVLPNLKNYFIDESLEAEMKDKLTEIAKKGN